MTKKIAIITQTLLSGGAEKQSVYLAKVLSRNFKVYLIVLRGASIELKFLNIIGAENVEIIRLSGGLLKNIISTYKLYRKEKIEIVFSYLARGNFINGLVGLIAGIKYRIGGIRNAELATQKIPFERFFHNYLLKKTISNSHSAVVGLKKLGFKENKLYVIHNEFDLKESYTLKENKNIINILSVARFVSQKDYFTALKAIKGIVSKMENSKYNIIYFLVGYGALEQDIRMWIKQLNIEENVYVIIKPENITSFFKKADIFLSTSLFEGMSNSVMEALSFSLPVVATPAGDMDFLVKEGVNGFLCDFKNYQQMADRLYELVVDYNLRCKMSLNSFQLLSEEFTMVKFEEKYLSLINGMNND